MDFEFKLVRLLPPSPSSLFYPFFSKNHLSVNIQIIAVDKKDNQINCRFTYHRIHIMVWYTHLLVSKSKLLCMYYLTFEFRFAHSCTSASHCMVYIQPFLHFLCDCLQIYCFVVEFPSNLIVVPDCSSMFVLVFGGGFERTASITMSSLQLNSYRLYNQRQ